MDHDIDPVLSDQFGLGELKAPKTLDFSLIDNEIDRLDYQTSYSSSSDKVIKEIHLDCVRNDLTPGWNDPPPQELIPVKDEFQKSILGDYIPKAIPKADPILRKSTSTATERPKRTPPDRKTKLREMIQPLMDFFQVSGEQSEECQQAIEHLLTSMSNYVERAVKLECGQ